MKKATVFKVILSDEDKKKSVSELAEALEQKRHVALTDQQLDNAGFIPHMMGDGQFILGWDGGFSFQVRFDEKVIPKSKVDEVIEMILSKAGKINPSKKERSEARELAMHDLLPGAYHKTKIINCFYDSENDLLYVEDISSKASVVIALLVSALGKVKTQTIHLEKIKHGLTTRLTKKITGEDEFAFNNMWPDCYVKIEHDEEEAITYNNIDLGIADGLEQNLCGGYEVKELGLNLYSLIYFVLNEKFKFKKIEFFMETEDDAELEVWKLEVKTKVFFMSKVVNELCEMLGYKDNQTGDSAVQEESKPTVTDNSDDSDPLYDDAVSFVTETGSVAVLQLQRKFGIGYNRAARIIERMEKEGICTEPGHNGSREVLVGKENNNA